ncbi:MAG: hypothetical protein M9962_10020 [Oligoflexia bacterium]|nr:hypothetical protein [Oligoflexia bacterium]
MSNKFINISIVFFTFAFVYLGFRFFPYSPKDPRLDLPPCFEVGEGFHHRFNPSCEGIINTPRGDIEFSTNEDGLREISRTDILKAKSKILVLGDSFVEGWWLKQEETISALLQENLKVLFVNAGIRSSGTFFQKDRLEKLVPIYKPDGIIWFISDTDWDDDRFFCALAKSISKEGHPENFSIKDFQSSGQKKIDFLLGKENFFSKFLKRVSYETNWKKIVDSQEANRCKSCGAFQEIKEFADRERIPIKAVLLPFPEHTTVGTYKLTLENRQKIKTCLVESGIDLLDSESFSSVGKNYYWENDIHFNPGGMRAYLEYLLPNISSWLKAFLLLN